MLKQSLWCWRWKQELKNFLNHVTCRVGIGQARILHTNVYSINDRNINWRASSISNILVPCDHSKKAKNASLNILDFILTLFVQTKCVKILWCQSATRLLFVSGWKEMDAKQFLKNVGANITIVMQTLHDNSQSTGWEHISSLYNLKAKIIIQIVSGRQDFINHTINCWRPELASACSQTWQWAPFIIFSSLLQLCHCCRNLGSLQCILQFS